MFKKRKKNNIKIKEGLIDLEAINDFVSNHLTQIVCSVAIILVFSLIFTFITTNNNTNKKKSMNEFYKATFFLNNKNENEGIKILTNLYEKNKNNTIKTISGIKLADILSNQDKKDEALKIYENVYNISDNKFFKNVAGLSYLNILINKNNKNDYSKIENLIKKMSNNDNPLINLLKEQEGLFELQRNNKEKGLKILKSLLNEKDIDKESVERIEAIINLY